MADYTNTSPWYTTQTIQNYLDVLKIRPVSASSSDILYTIDSKFAYRPDLLSYALYGTSTLWWVFIQRNLDVLQDPILDFVPGTKIYLPKQSELNKALGL
jgi:hypothetical protein